jgi:hypothetical protein
MDIDWSNFPEVPQQTVYCRCDVVHMSNAKMHMDGDKLIIWTQTPCPGCNRDHSHAKRVSSDPEFMAL